MSASDLFGHCQGNSQEFVFIASVDLINSGKGQDVTTISSVVRLQPLNECLGLVGSYITDASQSILSESNIGLIDWEHSFSIGKGGTSQFPSNIIEGRPHVMDAVSNHKGQVTDGEFLGIDEARMIDPIFRISITHDGVGVAVEEVPNRLFDKFQMVFGPLTLFEDSVDGWHGESENGEETENAEGRRNSHSEAGRLLQESEESRHAFSVPPSEEVASQTASSHHRGDCTATHIHSNNPEGAS